jgi:diguanylate cyclase (GGDEF)-like protein
VDSERATKEFPDWPPSGHGSTDTPPWSALVASCPSGFFEVDRRGVVIEWNPRAEELFGWRRDEVVGRSIADTLLPPDLVLSPANRGLMDTLGRSDQPEEGGVEGAAALPAGEPLGHRRQLVLAHTTGRRVAVEGILVTLGQGHHRSIAGFIDPDPFTSRVGGSPTRALDRDPLTGLPDRDHFTRCLTEAATRAGGVAGTVAVVLCDLDRFKDVNNSLGHEAGDRVLCAVADRLSNVAGDELVARLGGDEFLILVESPTGQVQRDAFAFIERAKEALSLPFNIDGSEMFLDASVGVALNTFGVDQGGTFLANAEAAMYRAKRRGGSRVEVFGESLRIETLDRTKTEHALHRALERHELMLHYQPVVEISGATTVVGVEALIRWQHPNQGLVAPTRFVPVAEESGLIIPIGAWVLEQACQQLRAWNHHVGNGPQGSVEVNLSARQIDDPRIVATVERILARTGLPPEHLTLEITESALMEDAAAALDVLRALKKIGVSLAIDDFGTGYSSLGYLQRFPLDFLKVDRSFVETLGVNADGEEIVSAVINLAHALGLKVVAEGVETAEQLEILRSLRCDFAQGFLFARPMPAADIVASFGLPQTA